MAVFSRVTLAHAVSGSLGSMLAMSLTYPLDRVRTLKQLEKNLVNSSVFDVLRMIVKKEGWDGLYSGLKPMLVALGASNFVYFYFFTALKAALKFFVRKYKLKIDEASAISNLVLASIAGTINVLVTTPLWVAFTRVAIQAKSKKEQVHKNPQENQKQSKNNEHLNGIFDAVYKIGKNEGLGGLWSGMGPSLILVSNPSVQFASYEWFKKLLLRIVHSRTTNGGIIDDSDSVGDELADLSSVEYLLLGAFSKMIATVVTYPLQIAQTRLRADNKKLEPDEKEVTVQQGNKSIKLKRVPSMRKYHGTVDCLSKIYESDGIMGLYSGIESKLLQTCLTSAFMFLAYEKICAIIFMLFVSKKKKKVVA